jgi:hypothetical protein
VFCAVWERNDQSNLFGAFLGGQGAARKGRQQKSGHHREGKA